MAVEAEESLLPWLLESTCLHPSLPLSLAVFKYVVPELLLEDITCIAHFENRPSSDPSGSISSIIRRPKKVTRRCLAARLIGERVRYINRVGGRRERGEEQDTDPVETQPNLPMCPYVELYTFMSTMPAHTRLPTSVGPILLTGIYRCACACPLVPPLAHVGKVGKDGSTILYYLL
ncbi:hypothetical protein KIPB_003591 [Kipferlia bialata]|uniref:Uncharacterized protein n=1 Tax=Kipferlia bialata TaxID=797122 RepID=A0A9K3GF24_9EUKA|nr:hypothetical protein KIPB_001260 [Kipferlia bialata]GIQ82451.1 hypothetical protein KIPB_003591 [Kipferlia bialata]|eukprot:g1260.t1